MGADRDEHCSVCDLLFHHCILENVQEKKEYILDFTADAPEKDRGLFSFLSAGNGKSVLSSPLLYIVLLLTSVGMAFTFALFGPVFGFICIGLIVGIPAVLYSVVNLKFGIIILLIISFFLQGFNRFAAGIPLGIVLDIFLVIMLIGLLIRKWQASDYTLAKNPISYVVWAWIGYNMLEFFNPIASTQAWIFVIRGIAILMIFYFIILYAIDGIPFFKTLINVWIVLSLLGGLYGLFQEFHGLLPFEKSWVASDDFRYKLIFNWGRYRIFSFFNDPTVYGVLMSYSALFCITLLTGPFKLLYKIFLAFSACVMMLAMVYAGTRTAFAMLPAGFIFYALLTFQTRTLAFAAFGLAVGAFVIFSGIRSLGPFLSTNSLERIRSAFKPSEDPSFQVRERSQAFIKPFIQSHPFGAGLGSIGIWGQRFTPGSALADFAPDSGYVRVAVELGWVGLLLYCTFFVVILTVGIRNYYRTRSPELRAYLAALLAVVFSLVIGNYPQQVLIQVPTILIFYAIMAMLVRLREIDEATYKE
ncbi:MAG TPA: O-antigen ligase family protein [Ohtaekwangia sp.]|uniref:O-antigen ligase family protein n=1 Tax=Ohtaekwangia sp. TaxID=2066019 RepID=UPI002F94ADE6